MLRQWFFWWLGIGILFANKVRYRITGYHRPREFSVAQTRKAVQYDHEVVERWERVLIEKGFGTQPFAGKRILELGPGADLGVGLILVAKGAESYTAYDKNPLADRAPKELHNAVITSIIDAGARKRAEEALLAYVTKQPTTLTFKQDHSFSFNWLPAESVDLVVSNAAFEHFDHVPEILTQVARVLAPGGALVAQVDLQTHTRVLRDRDPLNIYRYPRLLYRLAKFSGIPNRVRPSVYEKTLSDLGFTLIDIIPEIVMDEAKLKRDRPYVRRRYRKDPTLGVLSFIVIAKK
jgi:ubiquinone/menaquinone biosynthesis C-methylase UbiE